MPWPRSLGTVRSALLLLAVVHAAGPAPIVAQRLEGRSDLGFSELLRRNTLVVQSPTEPSSGRIWFGATLGAAAGLTAAFLEGFMADGDYHPYSAALYPAVGAVFGGGILGSIGKGPGPSILGLTVGAMAAALPVHLAMRGFSDSAGVAIVGTLIVIPVSAVIGDRRFRR